MRFCKTPLKSEPECISKERSWTQGARTLRKGDPNASRRVIDPERTETNKEPQQENVLEKETFSKGFWDQEITNYHK